MRYITFCMLTASLVLFLAHPATAKKCSPDSVQVGPACVDRYEASVWVTTDPALIKKISAGKITNAATLAPLTQIGLPEAGGDDYMPGCPVNGNGCVDFYAVSIPGVSPSVYVSWFMAAAICRNSSKRLATNYEWQMAALGTPDPGDQDDGISDCNTVASEGTSTGSRSKCISDTGAYDMVGNVSEWTADWAERATSCTYWPSGVSGGLPEDDQSCFGGTGDPLQPWLHLPGGIIRGGGFNDNNSAGVFFVDSFLEPYTTFPSLGFRCAR